MPPVDAHQARVARLVARLRERSAHDGFASLERGAVSHYVPDPHDVRHRDVKLDVRELDQILAIDPETRRCVAEPGVTFAELVRATLPLGLAPALVPELEGITVGGAVAGCAVESMAHRHGGFHDSCTEYEVVTARGEVLTCSRTRDAELFEMVHGSYGTLGVLTKLTFRLIPAKPFVRIRYHHHPSFESLLREMLRRCRAADNGTGGPDFIDAIAHGPASYVLCLGSFVDHAPHTSDYRREQIYFRSTLERADDYLTTEDYFFRFDTDCHWATRAIPGMGFPLVRRALGRWFLGSERLLNWSRRLRPIERLKKRPPVVTDVFIPRARALEFHAWYEAHIGFHPLWIVPYRMNAPYPWIARDHAAQTTDPMFVDFAIYGAPNDRPGIDLARQLENKARELGGIKTLIGENFYDEPTFWSLFDQPRYRSVKARVDPDNLFRDLYEKRGHTAHRRSTQAPVAEGVAGWRSQPARGA